MKRKLTLSLEEQVITCAKKAGINLSSFLEIRLMDYLSCWDDGSEGWLDRPVHESRTFYCVIFLGKHLKVISFSY